MFQIDEKLYRGQRPESFAQLVPLGITDVINLQSGTHEAVNNDKYEHEKASDFGMIEHNIKCSDIWYPGAIKVQRFLNIIENARGPVYVHCLHGKDRTGFMCAIYRMEKHGWNFQDARDEMFKMGFHKFPYLWWVFPLASYECK